MPDINERLKAIAEKQKRISAKRREIEVRSEEIESQIQNLRPVTGISDSVDLLSTVRSVEDQDS